MTTRTMIALMMLVCSITETYAEEPAKPILPLGVERAVLAEDWAKVTELLSAFDPVSPSPVLRLIKGHACLALNRNNESLDLFASTLDDESRNKWQTWADQFVNEHGDNAIAWYFQGDAFARRKIWNSASRSFDQALALDPGCYLALSARGVVSHAVGNTLQARMYFMKAIKSKRDFADAYANRGTLSVYLHSVKGEAMYEEAKLVSIDKDPLLPLVGIGCMMYGKQDYHSARKYFAGVSALSVISILAQRNALANEIAMLNEALESARKVGMSLQLLQLNNNSDQSIETVIVTEDGEIHIVLGNGEYIIYPNPDDNEASSIQQKQEINNEFINSPEGQAEIQRIQNWIENNPDKWRTATGRRYIAILKQLGLWNGGESEDGEESKASEMTIPPELLPPLGPGVVASTTGPGKRGGRGGGVRIPKNWRPPTRPGQGDPPPRPQPKPGRSKSLSETVKIITADISQQLAAFEATKPNVGGADSDPSKARSNRGSWGVSNVYGLLYAIPEPITQTTMQNK